MVESQQTWIESVIYSVEKLSHDEANATLGGITALLKSHCSQVLELVARESVQVLGGIGHTRGGRGERIERIKREVPGAAVPGVRPLPFSESRIDRRSHRDPRRSCSTTAFAVSSNWPQV